MFGGGVSECKEIHDRKFWLGAHVALFLLAAVWYDTITPGLQDPSPTSSRSHLARVRRRGYIATVTDTADQTEPFAHRAGALEVRLATSDIEIAAAQRLRYRIFFEEEGARASEEARVSGLDIDVYDSVCDHLLVFDHAQAGAPVVGTYRLLRQDVAARHGGFYSAGEFDLGPLLAGAGTGLQLLELGRSCVAAAYRDAPTISLLWRGVASYLKAHGIGHMFGCGSLHGVDVGEHARSLAYLHHHHLAPPELPPLIKGYLRVGAMIGDGGSVDRDFNTIDVFVIMPVDRITERYAARYMKAD